MKPRGTTSALVVVPILVALAAPARAQEPGLWWGGLFGYRPALTVGEWLIEEAVRSAREQLVPTPMEARRFDEQGDWGNAAWAYDVLTSLDPENGTWAERLERARARLR
jgi:hypothetical protein